VSIEDGRQPNNQAALYCEQFLEGTRGILKSLPDCILGMIFFGLNVNDKKKAEQLESFQRALDSSENFELRQIYAEYRAVLHRYFKGRLPVLFWASRKVREIGERVDSAEEHIPTAATSEPSFLPFTSRLIRT